MPTRSIKQHTNTLANHRDAEAIRAVLTNLLEDVTALRASILLITAKLDLDAGVTDEDYASTTNPAALTTTV
jgi:hypothetical protein